MRPTRRRRLTILECQVADDTGPLKAVWFNQAYLADQLKEGVAVLLRGRLEAGRGGPTFRVAEHEIRRGSDEGLGRHTTGLVPVYPATEGLSARRIRELAWGLRGLQRHAVEPLPAQLACEGRPAYPGRRRCPPPTGLTRSTMSPSRAAASRSRSCSCSSWHS